MTKSIKIIFTLSVLLNVILLGLVGAGAYKKYQWHNRSMPSLSAESQTLLKENIDQTRSQMKESFKEVRVQHDALKNVVTADEFDRAAYDEAVEKILESKNDMARTKATQMGDLLAQMPQEDRAQFSQKMLKSLSGKGGPRGGHGEWKKGRKHAPKAD